MVGDPHMQVRRFHQKLFALFEDQDTVDPEEVSQIDDFFEALKHLDALHTEADLSDAVCRRAWPAYVQTLQKEHYWPEVWEVLLLCVLAKQSVATVTNQEGALSLVASYLEADMRPVALTISGRSMRGHFERLLFGGPAEPCRRSRASGKTRCLVSKRRTSKRIFKETDWFKGGGRRRRPS